MATFVIVHGVYDGGWRWRDVRRYLEGDSHAVYTPTLTGYGERSHLASPAINLDTHIQDAVNVLEYEDLNQVVLVGHSYGGMVITGVADRVPRRLRQLVYLDAFVPRDGETVLDLAAPDELGLDPPSLGQRLRAQARAGAWQLPPPEGEPRRSPVLVNTATQPIRLTAAVASLPRAFIRCTGRNRGPSADFNVSAERARTEPGWKYYELAAGHAAPWQAPVDVGSLLTRLVADSG